MGGVYAALLQAVCVVIVLGGLKTSTITVNSFSFVKVGGSGQRSNPSSWLARVFFIHFRINCPFC